MKRERFVFLFTGGVVAWALLLLALVASATAAPLRLAPALQVEPTALAVSLGVGQRVTATLTLSNTGDAPLHFEIWEHHPPTATEFLILDHGRDKGGFAGHTYNVATESQFGALTAAELAAYPAVYLEPSWSSYDNLNVPALTAYVEGGGVGVINVAGNIGSREDVDPAGTDYHREHTHNNEVILLPGHPYITGASYGGTPLTANDFKSWWSSDHGWLTGYPDDAWTVLQNDAGASWVQYRWGKGQVILTTFTYGWGSGGGRGAPFANLVAYARQISGIPWLAQQSVSGTVPAGEARQVTVVFSAMGLAPGTYSDTLKVASDDPSQPLVEVPVEMQVTDAGLSPSTKEVSHTTAHPTDRLTYTITLQNASAAPALAVFTDPIPINATYVAGSVTGGAAYSDTVNAIWWQGPVPAAGTQTFTFQVDVTIPPMDLVGLVNVATVEDRDHNRTYWRGTTTLVQTPLLSGSTKSVEPTSTLPGDTLTYTVRMQNTGHADAVGTTLTDPIPPHTAYVPGSATGGATYNVAQNRVEWTGTIPAGGETSVGFQVTVNAMDNGVPIVNTATVAHPWTWPAYPQSKVPVLLGRKLLVIEDDGGTDYLDRYTQALEASGHRSYDVWPADGLGSPSSDLLGNYAAVVWYGGWNKWGFTSANQTAITDYLNSGGRLLITGEDFAEGLWGSTFLSETLHVRWLADTTGGALTIRGLPGDVLDGVSGAFTKGDQDVLEPADALAVPIAEYSGASTGVAGVRVMNGASRFIFLAYNLEQVEDPAVRAEMLGRCLNWLLYSRADLPLVLRGGS